MKKLFILSVLSLILSVLSLSSAYDYWIKDNWVVLNNVGVFENGVFKKFQDARDFNFIDSVNGYFVGSYDVTGTWILKTTDGGYNWSTSLKDSNKWDGNNLIWHPSEITAADAFKNLIVVGTTTAYYFPFSTDTGYVWISVDTGKNWEMAYPNKDLKEVFFIPSIFDQNYVALGSRNRLAISEDSGKSWRLSGIFPSQFLDTLYTITEMKVVNRNKFYIARFHSVGDKTNNNPQYIGFTSDEGNSWKINSINRKWIQDAAFLDSTIVYITGVHQICDTCPYKAYIDKSTDTGESWTNVLDTLFQNWSATDISTRIRFYDKSNGIMAGGWGYLFHTIDSGKTWYYEGKGDTIPDPDSMDYFRGFYSKFEFKTKDSLIIYEPFNSKILIAPLTTKFIDTSDTTGIVEIISENNHDLIYPNPAKQGQQVTVRFETMTGEYDGFLFDNTGTLMEQGFHLYFSGGVHTLNLQTSSLSSGVYFLKIQNRGKLYKTIKFIVE